MVSDKQAGLVLGLIMLGLILVFPGILLSANRRIPLILKGMGALVPRIGPSSTVAVSNISRNRSRVAATGASLLIGVSLESTLATGAPSAKQTMSDILDEHYRLMFRLALRGWMLGP